jgi:DNA-binding transcriptional regulator YhcF (GntR family)
MKHDSEFVRALSRETGLSRRTIKRGLDDLISAGYLAHDARGYVAVIKDEPPLIRRRARYFLRLWWRLRSSIPTVSRGRNDQ